MKNEEAWQRAKEDRNVLHKIKRRKGNSICHILSRNYIIKYVIGEKIKGAGSRGRRRKQLLDDFKAAFPTLGLAEQWCLRCEQCSVGKKIEKPDNGIFFIKF
jgi:hypothetical protein